MTIASEADGTLKEKPAPQKETAAETLARQRLRLTRRNPKVVIGAAVVLFWIFLALFGTYLRPFDYEEMIDLPWQKPSSQYWFGTDRMGRDMFTRIAYGARLMLVLPTTAIALSVLAGSFIGLLTGYIGGTVDEVVMRIMDIMMAFPMLMIYLLVIFAIGPSAVNVIWAIAIGTTPGIARLVRGLTMDMRNREFVIAAKMRGESSLYIMFREILPNITGPVIVDACIRIAFAMFATGSLGYLGLGVPPPYPDWGNMIGEGRTWIFQFPWAPIPPIIAISSLVVALNLIADGLRETGWVD